MKFSKNPAVYISLIGAILALAVGFGLKISGVQVESILNLAGILIPLLFTGTAVAIRSQVYNSDSIKTALAMPPESTPALLDKVIAADVTVKPGDTKVEIVNAISDANKVNDA